MSDVTPRMEGHNAVDDRQGLLISDEDYMQSLHLYQSGYVQPSDRMKHT